MNRDPKRDLVGYGRQAPPLRWPDGTTVAVSIVINYEEGSENAEAAGDPFNEIPVELSGSARKVPVKGMRDLHSECSFEFGARAGVWRLLDVVHGLNLPVTWFASAEALELNPEVASAIVERRDEVAAHGLRWGGPRHCSLSEEQERDVIAQATTRIERVTGQRPRGWFTRYGPSMNTRRLLVEADYLYDSDSFADDRPYVVQVGQRKHVVVPYSFTYNDNRFVVPQGFSSPSGFVDEFCRAVTCLSEEGRRGRVGMLSVGLHPRIAGQAGRAHAVREALEFAARQRGVWFALRRDIAEVTRSRGDAS